MITPDHECSWTRRHRSQLSWNGEHLFAAGVPRTVITSVASRLGYVIAEEPDPDDEDGVLLTLGPWQIALHDGCFVHLDSHAESLRDAFLHGAVELHDHYLGSVIGPAGVDVVRARLKDGMMLVLQSDVQRREFQVKSYPSTAGWWARRRAPVERVVVAGH